MIGLQESRMEKGEARFRKRKELPDEVYLSMENCIEEIMDILKRPGNEEHMNGRAHHLVGRDFRFMFMEEHHAHIRERIKKAKTSKDKDK